MLFVHDEVPTSSLRLWGLFCLSRHSSNCVFSVSPPFLARLPVLFLPVLKDYPYTAEGGLCKKTSCDVVEGTMVDKWVDVDHENEEVTQDASASAQGCSLAWLLCGVSLFLI